MRHAIERETTEHTERKGACSESIASQTDNCNRGIYRRQFLQMAIGGSAILLAPQFVLATGEGLALSRDGKWLIIQGGNIPGNEIRVHYLEAYCRAGSSNADWGKTVIPYTSELLSLSADKKVLRLRDTLADGLIVEHTITAGKDEVDFRLVAHNPTAHRSEAHWAQPCVRLATFTGFGRDDSRQGDINDYLSKCFIFLDGQLARMPTRDWATQARYVPGQVWCPGDVPRSDVNPRPLSKLVPSNGLIGAFSGDDKVIFATAWDPYQELFQGVFRCLHSDLRLGGIDAGETRRIRGKIYILPNDVPELLTRYGQDFSERR